MASQRTKKIREGEYPINILPEIICECPRFITRSFEAPGNDKLKTYENYISGKNSLPNSLKVNNVAESATITNHTFIAEDSYVASNEFHILPRRDMKQYPKFLNNSSPTPLVDLRRPEESPISIGIFPFPPQKFHLTEVVQKSPNGNNRSLCSSRQLSTPPPLPSEADIIPSLESGLKLQIPTPLDIEYNDILADHDESLVSKDNSPFIERVPPPDPAPYLDLPATDDVVSTETLQKPQNVAGNLIAYPEVVVDKSNIHLSFVLKNHTGGKIFQIRIFPQIPDTLRIFLNVPVVPELQAGERLELNYDIEPTSSGEFYIGGDILYEDPNRHPQSVTVPPVSFNIRSSLTSKPLQLNMDLIREQIPHLCQVFRDIYAWELPRELLGPVVNRALTSLNLRVVEGQQSSSALTPISMWFAKRSESSENLLFAQLLIFAQPTRVSCTAWGADNATITEFLTQFFEILEADISLMRHFQENTRSKALQAVRVGELFITLEDLCLMEWHCEDICLKLQELLALLNVLEIPSSILKEMDAWICTLSNSRARLQNEANAMPSDQIVSFDLTPAESGQLETALVHWKYAVDQFLSRLVLSLPSAMKDTQETSNDEGCNATSAGDQSCSSRFPQHVRNSLKSRQQNMEAL